MALQGLVPIKECKYNDKGILRKCEIKVIEPMSYNTKIVRSGKVVEIYRYSDKRWHGYQVKEKDNRQKPDEWNGKIEKNLHRARLNIRRLIWCNMTKYSKFVTFTYAENQKDLKTFFYDWQKMQQRMKRQGIILRYLYVIEYQQRGAIHAHCVVFNEEYIPIEILQRAWGKGHVDINSIKSVKNLGAYVCKYLTKETIAEYKSKSYHVSKGLNKPVEERKTLRANEGFMQGKEPIYTAKYDLKSMDIITGQVEYSQFLIN